MPSKKNNTPPYVPYRTFQNFIEFLQNNGGVPYRIDSSVWQGRFAGSSGAQIMHALRVLELVDEASVTSKNFERMVLGTKQERRKIFRATIEKFYQPIFDLEISKATSGQFREAFKSYGLKDAVTTKCEAFFIHAAQDTGIQLSQFITRRRHNLKRRSSIKNSTDTEIATKTNESLLNNSNNILLDTDTTDTTTLHNNIHRTDTDTNTNNVKENATNSVFKVTKDESSRFALAEMILSKYPEFDTSWSEEVQFSWLEGVRRIYETLIEIPKSN